MGKYACIQSLWHIRLCHVSASHSLPRSINCTYSTNRVYSQQWVLSTTAHSAHFNAFISVGHFSKNSHIILHLLSSYSLYNYKSK